MLADCTHPEALIFFCRIISEEVSACCLQGNGSVMEGAPCTKSTNKRMAVFVFPCTGGEGITTLGFLSHPLHLTRGRGQAQAGAELHICVEGARNWNNKVSLSACRALPVAGVGDAVPKAALHEGFRPALATKGSCLGVPPPRLLASTPQLLCNRTEGYR